jgi:hypothetical protein
MKNECFQSFVFYTEGFSVDDTGSLIEKPKTLGVESKPSKYREYIAIGLVKSEFLKIAQMSAPYVQETMKYKIYMEERNRSDHTSLAKQVGKHNGFETYEQFIRSFVHSAAYTISIRVKMCIITYTLNVYIAAADAKP